MSYDDVHKALKELRGVARQYRCVSCGKQAEQWAYRYNGDPELASGHGPYSEDIQGCYQPMCASCHRKHDLEKDPRLREIYRSLGRQVGLLPATEASILSLKKARAAQSPEDKKKQGEHMGRVHAERLKNDPTYAEQHREYSRRNALKRRKCSQCDLVSHPPGIARHQKSSGHSGYTDL